MKKSIFLFALLSVAIFGFNRAMAIELDTVWVSDTNGQVLFQHPITKNILVAANGGITELNSQDGKFVRSFPLNTENTLEMSPDGTKMLYYFWEDTKFIIELYDYNTQKVIFKTAGLMPKFLDNNNFVFLLPSDGKQVNLNKCKIDNLEITKHPISSNGSVTAFSTSPNGKYIAYATYKQNNVVDSKVYLNLVDAETMQGIGELGSWDSKGQQIDGVSFSSNNRYLTILPGTFQEILPVNIYDLTTKKIINSFFPANFDYSTCGVIFLNDEYYLVRGYNFNETSEVRICRLTDNKIIYKSTDLQFYTRTAIFNSEYKHLYINTIENKNYCFDFNNIISGILQVTPFSIRYHNRKLIINNNNNLINNISVMTIEGREVYHQSFEVLINMSNPIEIPLELSNGSYIINLVSDKETYTEKIIIVD